MEPAPRVPWSRTRLIFLLIPIVFCAVQEVVPFGPPPPAHRGLSLLFLMAFWWITETLPLHWVAAVPLILLPILPVTNTEEPFPARTWANFSLAASQFIHPLIFLFLGGMTIGAAMEEHNLHRRIALNIIRRIGSTPRRVLLGFVVSTAAVSSFISNTATAVMMVPIGLAVLSQMEAVAGRKLVRFGEALMLSIAYAANVGGIGTLIGTAPNAIFAGFVGETYGVGVGFLEYLPIGLPFVLLFLPIVYAALLWRARGESIAAFSPEVLAKELAALGPMSRGEKAVLAVFLGACAGWIFNLPIRIVCGLEAWNFRMKPDQFDGGVAMLAALLLFLLPGRTGECVLRARSLRRVSWDALVLLAGSFAMAAAIAASGLPKWFSHLLGDLARMPDLPLLGIVTLSTVFLSAFSSNTATANVMLALVLATLDPTRTQAARTVPFLSGVTISASCDFMLPAGTPPNAIVFATRYVRIGNMVRTGAVLDLLAAVAAAVWVYFCAGPLLAWIVPQLRM